MLTLSNSQRIAKGLDPECFVHPHDPNLCVKVTVSGDHTQSRDEQRYFKRLAARGISWKMLARFMGIVPTDRGDGMVFELIRDFDGPVSRTLSFYLSDSSLSADVLRANLRGLYDYLLGERIIVRDLKSDNVVCQRSGPDAIKFMIVDGLGNNELIPISEMSNFLLRRKILRKWRDFEHRLIKRYPNHRDLFASLATVQPHEISSSPLEGRHVTLPSPR